MQIIKKYVSENSKLLFEHINKDSKKATFDNKGFFLSNEAQADYNNIKNQPHLYVAWTNSSLGNYYVGKSFQIGGRWKRQHAYHLGTLAHHLLKTIRYDDQNHSHWIDCWMNSDSMSRIEENKYIIELNHLVYICFIPFYIYSNIDYNTLEKSYIRKTNTTIEKQLIQAYKDDNLNLLNVQHN